MSVFIEQTTTRFQNQLLPADIFVPDLLAQFVISEPSNTGKSSVASHIFRIAARAYRLRSSSDTLCQSFWRILKDVQHPSPLQDTAASLNPSLRMGMSTPCRTSFTWTKLPEPHSGR